MKKLALMLAMVGFAGLAAAQDPKPVEPAKPAKDQTAMKAKTHEVDAEVVSFDAAAKTLTIKGTPDNKTIPVDAKALASAATLKAGDTVVVTCRDNDKGEHVAVAGVRKK
jgi:hypothetical protein